MTAPECRTANDLPDLRLHLMRQWDDGAPFSRVAHSVPMGVSADGFAYNPSGYVNYERQALAHASLWWVADDMVDLLLASAPTIPTDALGDELQVPAPGGLIVFAKPWFGLDSWGTGNAVQVDALVWGTARLPRHPGEPERLAWALSTYTRVCMVPNEASAPGEWGTLPESQWADDSPRVPGVGELNADTVVLPAGLASDILNGGEAAIREWGGTAIPARNIPGGVHARGTIWVPLGRSDWEKAKRLDERTADIMDDAQAASAIEDRRVFAAFCALIAQEGITRTEVRPAQRQAAKRTERAGLAREASTLRIITLRPVHRTEAPDDGDSRPTAYSHRWIVNGHWRWQPYGPGRSMRRLQYIRPFVKGPEGAELKIKQEVRAWVR